MCDAFNSPSIMFISSENSAAPMHSAAKAGYLNVVKLLVESGASTMAETSGGRVPLWYAAAEGNVNVVTYLISQKHDSYR